MKFTADLSRAHQLDAQDELASFRDRFVLSDPDLIYLDGNSLGRLPKATVRHLGEAIEHQWGERLIRGWNEGWFQKPHELGAKIAQLIGAQPDEVVVGDTTSINLFKLVVAALRAYPGRKKIVSDELNFPSDLYVFQGVIDLLAAGHELELIPSRDTISIQREDVEATLGEDTALLALTHVAFKSAFMYDMEHITKLAHQAGGLALWDLSHSVGAVPLKLNAWDVDLAVGCTYKYLNGGPGSPAFLYVRRELQEQLMQPIWGWFATKAPFDFNLDFTPAEGMSRFQISTPQVLSMLGLEPALDILLEAGMDRLREKSVRQTEYLIFLAREWLLPLGFSLGSPLDSAQRGSHVSLRHPEGYRISRAMIESPPLDRDVATQAGPDRPGTPAVIPDFRTPDNIRLGIAPLYTSFTDIHRALGRMREIVTEGIYREYSKKRLEVT
ncbi:MAG: Kynureninase [Chloroflexi bacterium]|nr:Kynureninase [Chloroflexota bacterium]